jgi:ubiquinone/menaquinone biosynthesis C-methylase UbiE
MKTLREVWDSQDAINKYAVEFYLFEGEKTSLNACFPNGWQNKSVLDLGCGGGRTTYFLCEKAARTIGVDISEGLIQAAKNKYPGVHFHVGDATQLGFKDKTFDAVLFSFNGLDCLYPKDQRNQAIREIFRVMRQGGKFILSHHNIPALIFGWYKSMRPRKLLFRFSQIINRNVLQSECYIHTPEFDEPLTLYYAWPSHFIGEMESHGFAFQDIHPNSRLLGLVQRSFQTSWLTKLADPWPYYVFQKK